MAAQDSVTHELPGIRKAKEPFQGPKFISAALMTLSEGMQEEEIYGEVQVLGPRVSLEIGQGLQHEIPCECSKDSPA